MNGGVRKRGATWSYYFDLGKIDGKRKKVVSAPKKKQNKHLLLQSMNTPIQGSVLPHLRL